MKLGTILFLMLVLLAALLVHYFLIQEGFSDSTKKDASGNRVKDASGSNITGSQSSGDGLTFSELVSAILAYSPITSSQKKQNSTLQEEESASVEDIEKLVKDEVADQLKSIKTGPKDTANEDLSKRSTDKIETSSESTCSDSLQQGAWFRFAAEEGCPYAKGQTSTKPIDPSDYIRKDSIPCWGCSLK